jgi:hypothetical protein
MIKKRYLLLLLSSLVVLILAGALLFIKKRQKEKLSNAQSLIIIEKVGKISKISIQKPGNETIVLTKSNNNWSVGPKNYPADPDKIKGLLDAVAKINQAEIVSNNKERHKLFQVDEKATKLTLEYPEKTIIFLVGKTSIQRQGTFVREKGDNRVFLIPSYLGSSIDTKDWKDHQITDFLEGEIDKITISREKQEMVLEKKDEKWQYQEKELEKERVQKLANLLRNLRGENIYTPDEKKIEEKEKFKITISSPEKTVLLSLTNKPEPLIQKDKKFLYSISKEKFAEIEKTIREMEASLASLPNH